MKRIRSNNTYTVLHNRWNHTQEEFNGTEVHHDLTDDGGILEQNVNHLIALACGHYAEPAGLCSVCERTVCGTCMLVCSTCAMPIGKCHATQVSNGEWLCTACSDAQKRKKLMRFLLSPLIRFKDDTDD